MIANSDILIKPIMSEKINQLSVSMVRFLTASLTSFKNVFKSRVRVSLDRRLRTLKVEVATSLSPKTII